MKDKKYTHIYLVRKINADLSWVFDDGDPDLTHETIESNLMVEMPIIIPVGSDENSQEQDFIAGWLVDEFPHWQPLAYCSLEEIP